MIAIEVGQLWIAKKPHKGAKRIAMVVTVDSTVNASHSSPSPVILKTGENGYGRPSKLSAHALRTRYELLREANVGVDNGDADFDMVVIKPGQAWVTINRISGKKRTVLITDVGPDVNDTHFSQGRVYMKSIWNQSGSASRCLASDFRARYKFLADGVA